MTEEKRLANSNKDDNTIELFGDLGNDVPMPGEISNNREEEENNIDIEEDTTKLISPDVSKALSGKTVKSVMLPEENGILLPNYIIDVTDVGQLDPIQTMALDSLLNEEGDTNMYIVFGKNIQKLGVGQSWLLNKILITAISNIFDDKCKIYKDYKIGEKAVQLRSKDISHLRLSI